MSELPDSWVETTLGDITADSAQRVPAPDEQFQYVDIASIDRLTKRITSPQLLWGRDAPSRARKEIRAGDVLVSMTRPNLNAVVLVPLEFDQQIASTGFDVLRSIGIEPRWLFYVVRAQSFIDRMSELVQGALYPAVRSKDVRGYIAPLAPLKEQKRIADKLDAILARVDACRERLARVPAILQRFRQAVLAAATSGKLTEEWRATVSGDDLVDWQPVTLESLLDGKPRNGYSPRAVEYDTPVKSLTLTATTTGRFRPEHFKYIDEDIPPSSYLWLQPGDILIQRANTIEYVGISAIYDGPPNGFIYPDLMMKCRANARALPTFLHYVLLSEPVRRHFRENATGTAGNMPKINQRTVLGAPALVPPLREQSEIVRRVEALFAYADRLEARYTAARTQVERLTPALLAKAFRGELVPQDPSDEPSSVLLERIRALRAEQPMEKRGRKLPVARVPRAPKEKATMTKSRHDDDVQHKPYLAGLLREAGGITSVEDLFRRAELPVTDFYKQLAWEVENGHICDDETRLEAA